MEEFDSLGARQEPVESKYEPKDVWGGKQANEADELVYDQETETYFMKEDLQRYLADEISAEDLAEALINVCYPRTDLIMDQFGFLPSGYFDI